MRLALLILFIYSPFAFAGRYSEELNNSGDGFEYLFWIPIGLAIFLYQRFEKKGFGGFAATVGGIIGLAFIYYFPLISAVILAILFVYILIENVF